MLRGVVVPIGVAAGFLVALVIAGARTPVPRPRRPPTLVSVGQGVSLARALAPSALGGYLFFLGLVLVTSEWIVGEPGSFASAVRGGAVLATGSIPVFVVMTALLGRRRP